MKIETQISESSVLIRLAGRLDATWAAHVHGAASEFVRDGHHRLRIDASGLEYLSSAGLRTLLRIRRDLDAVNGSLAIVRASPFVRETLRMSGLETLLAPDGEEAGVPAAAAPREAAPDAREPVPGMRIERHVLDPGGHADLRVHSAWTPWDPVRAGDLVEMEFPRHRFGLGIGAPGSGPDDARGRLGDFAAAAGCLAWLPGDGAESPDYLEQEDRLVPRLHAAQALAAEGAFSHLLRFQPGARDASISVDDLLDQALESTGAGAVAAVVLAEIDGLVGAALARSPGLIQAGDRPGDFPEIRNWIAFCGERLHRRSLALVVAFAARDAGAASRARLAPSPFRNGLCAHAHAVVLPFRPLPRGVVDFEPSVRAAFAESSPLGVLHLLGDDRPIGGLGQSTFIRGACWCAPLQRPTEPRS